LFAEFLTGINDGEMGRWGEGEMGRKYEKIIVRDVEIFFKFVCLAAKE
jgi:hypothetical protein